MKQKRDSSTHRTPAQTVKHRHGYQQRPEVKARKQKLDRDAYHAKKAGKIKPGEDTGHTTPLASGGMGKGKSNVKSQNRAQNRGHGMGKSGTKPDAATTRQLAKTRQLRKRLS